MQGNSDITSLKFLPKACTKFLYDFYLSLNDNLYNYFLINFPAQFDFNVDNKKWSTTTDLHGKRGKAFLNSKFFSQLFRRNHLFSFYWFFHHSQRQIRHRNILTHTIGKNKANKQKHWVCKACDKNRLHKTQVHKEY